MKENEHDAETRDWTRDIQIFSLTLSDWAISAYLWLIFTLKLRSLQKTQTLRKSGNWILEPIHKRLYCIYGKFLRHRGISSNGRARA